MAAQLGDPAVSQAMAAAAREDEPAHVTQYLAGVPDLIHHYQSKGANPYGRAIITAAMDAARLTSSRRWPPVFLEQAAAGYLASQHRARPARRWRQDAFGYAARELRGAVRALTPVPPPHGTGTAAYQLADALHQHGRQQLAETTPPPAFWEAAVAHAPAATLYPLAQAAKNRGLLRISAQLCKKATPTSTWAAMDLMRLLHDRHPADLRPADWVATRADLSGTWCVARLLKELREISASEQVAALLQRIPADASLRDQTRLVQLLGDLQVLGACGQAAAPARNAAAHADLSDFHAVARLLKDLREAAIHERITAWHQRDSASRCDLGNLYDRYGVTDLLKDLREAVSQRRSAGYGEPGNLYNLLHYLYALAELLRALHEVGASRLAAALARNAAAHADLSNSLGVAFLLSDLRKAGASEQAAALIQRDPAKHADISDPLAVGDLLTGLREAGASGQAAALLRRDPATHADPSNSYRVTRLLESLQEAGAREQVTAPAARAAAYTNLSDPLNAAELLQTLRKMGASEQAAALLQRDPAAHADLNKTAPP